MKEKNNKAKNNFVPEYFLWLEPDEQKRRAKELTKMTKRKQEENGEKER